MASFNRGDHVLCEFAGAWVHASVEAVVSDGVRICLHENGAAHFVVLSEAADRLVYAPTFADKKRPTVAAFSGRILNYPSGIRDYSKR